VLTALFHFASYSKLHSLFFVLKIQGLMMKHITTATFILFFLSLNTYAQNIDSTIEKYANDFGQERAYLHYDKSTYAPGETIWFKAYLMKAIYPAEESKTMYVDWTDDKGNLLFRSMAPIEDATTNGQFDIPATYSGKFIHAKAYTKWMLNFDSSFLYNKDIRILSKSNSASVSKNTVIPSVQFFPEGGDAIAGVQNKIAFKANDQYGRPIKIRGVIKNNAGVTVDSLHVIHDGMGYFVLTPKAGESFTAKWFVRNPLEKDAKSTEHSTPLPDIKNNGVSLQVNILAQQRIFKISTSPAQAASLGTLHIIGTMYQHEVFKLTKDIAPGFINGAVPTKDLPSGILTITVFDNQWKPLAERITYINNEEYLFYPQMEVQHWGLNKRARDEIKITVPDSIAANLSVAVTDMDIDADSSDNIISHLLLTGDLRGSVYNPSYYFTNISDTLSNQLDLVMLTHGWRRFNWNNVAQGKFPKIIYAKDTSYLTISGKIYGGTPSQLRDAGNIVLLLQQKKGTQMRMAPIKPDGSFNDPTTLLFDTAHVFYQIPKSKGLSDVSVKFMESRMPPLTYNTAASSLLSYDDTTGNARHLMLSDEALRLLNLYKGKVLETVTIKAKTKPILEQMDEKYASGLFQGGDGYQFDVLHDSRAVNSLNIFSYLQGQVAGLQINTTSTPPTLQWRGGTPQLYLDEMNADPDMLSSIPISDVAYIKVLRPPFMGGTGGGASGAIAIYTRRGDDAKSEPGKGLSSNTVTGYSELREFYSPNYATFTTDNDKRDLRTTLYWNPQVITTPQNNEVVLTFYNNDISNGFRVVIEGMTKDGRLAHVEQLMQ
jgi:hypothetical protein